MTDMSYADAPFAVRNDLGDAHAATWERIASPGTWFDGETRVAIAAETRNAGVPPLRRAQRGAVALCRRRHP